MRIEIVEGEERIIREVKRAGNGAHVFAPKEWLGEEVFIVRAQRVGLRERILDVLEPYLESITGVYLYGSYARGEANRDSDIDILVITSKKIKIKHRGFEIISLREREILKSIKISPILIYSALAEAKPIINSELLEELKKRYKPELKDFKKYLKETENVIKINTELLDPYSIILRLRGIYIINQLMQGKSYSHKGFRAWVLRNVSDIDYEKIYEDYRNIKRGIKKYTTMDGDLQKVLEFLEKETSKLERRINGKNKKEA